MQMAQRNVATRGARRQRQLDAEIKAARPAHGVVEQIEPIGRRDDDKVLRLARRLDEAVELGQQRAEHARRRALARAVVAAAPPRQRLELVDEEQARRALARARKRVAQQALARAELCAQQLRPTHLNLARRADQTKRRRERAHLPAAARRRRPARRRAATCRRRSVRAAGRRQRASRRCARTTA